MKKSNIIFGSFGNLKNYSSMILIYDSHLKKYKNELIKKSSLNVIEIPIKANENSKNIFQLMKIYKTLSKNNVDKKSVLVALGGGVVGDIAGFVASTYLRGISFVSVPTTILSQVDSSLGGKNGVNLKAGKNLVGTFYQPDTIFIDYKYLNTLPDREVISGLGEIFKYSLLAKNIKFPELPDHKFNKGKFLNIIQKLTPKCVSYKMKLVAKDERDEKGIRQFLNLGHTFGHVLEAYTSYKTYKHGEAVVWGIKFACVVSYLKGIMNFEDFRNIMNLANKLLLPALPKKLNAKKCYSLALKDKKSHNQKVKMVLLKKKGTALTDQNVSESEFKEAVELLKDF